MEFVSRQIMFLVPRISSYRNLTIGPTIFFALNRGFPLLITRGMDKFTPFGVTKTEALVFVAVALLVHYLLRTLSLWKRLPPGPWGLPILGYLPFLDNNSPTQFKTLTEKYGDVFGMKLGFRYAVVVNKKESILEVMYNPKIISRPDHIMEMGPHVMHVANSNDKSWTEQRKFFESYSKLFSRGAHEKSLSAIISRQVEVLFEEIMASIGQEVNLLPLISTNMRNAITETIWGGPYDIEDTLTGHELEALQTNMMQEATPTCLSGLLFFPQFDSILRKIHPKLRNFAKQQHNLNETLRGKIRKRMETFNPGDDSDFIDLYLNHIENSGYLNEGNLIGNIQVFMIGGTDTIISSLTFLFVELGKRPDIQDKIYNELINAFGLDGNVTWAERNKAPYTMATIYEGQRYNLVVPISTVRIAIEDTTIGRYHIPKKSLVFGNLWLAHNNNKDWDEPENFKPERYLDSNNNLDHRKLFLPFSAGKRVCPGKEQALIQLFLVVSSILRRFKVFLPKTFSSELTNGLVVTLAKPIVRFETRY